MAMPPICADLLDIEGKVTLITVSTGTIHPTTISDPEQIQRIVTLFSEAPADQKIRSRPSLADRYVIEFHMADGLNVTSTYWPVLGRTALGIYPPDELATIIEEQK